MMIKVLLISLIYNMSIGLWSPPVGDKFDKELFIEIRRMACMNITRMDVLFY